MGNGLTEQQSYERSLDTPHDEGFITDLSESDNYYEFGMAEDPNGKTTSGFSRKKDEFNLVPKVGDSITVYTVQWSRIRGMDINGIPQFYMTQDELDEDHKKMVENHERDDRERFEQEKDKLDEDYLLLPAIFKARIDKFRNANPDFRWKYEHYEMFVCTEAIKMADRATSALASHSFDDEMDAFYADDKMQRDYAWPDSSEPYPEPENPGVRWLTWADALNSKAYDYDYQRQQEVLGSADGHSGNTFGAAMLLAKLYLSEPEMVEKMHGALVPLVGCKEYGCPHEEP